MCGYVFMSMPICWPHVPPLAALNQSRSREAHSCVRGGELQTSGTHGSPTSVHMGP